MATSTLKSFGRLQVACVWLCTNDGWMDGFTCCLLAWPVILFVLALTWATTCGIFACFQVVWYLLLAPLYSYVIALYVISSV
jgi:hypothetical protein